MSSLKESESLAAAPAALGCAGFVWHVFADVGIEAEVTGPSSTGFPLPRCSELAFSWTRLGDLKSSWQIDGLLAGVCLSFEVQQGCSHLELVSECLLGWKLAGIMVWFGGWVAQDSSELSNVIAEMISVWAYQTAEERRTSTLHAIYGIHTPAAWNKI